MLSQGAYITSGSAVAAGKGALLASVVNGAASAGVTLKIHDVATVGGASAGNQVAELALDAVQTFHFYGLRFVNGLVVVASGACKCTVVWG